MQPTRSLLFVPSNRENMVQRAHHTPADVIVLDLEDAVTPDMKASAREGIRTSIESLKAAGKTVHVRINHLDTGHTRDDLIAVIGPGLDAILYPKVEAPADVRDLDVLIREQELHKDGVKPGQTALIPMIESARAVLRCEEIAQASTRIAALTLGGEDYAADLGVARTPEGRELDHIRHVIVNVCVAYKLTPLDGIYAPCTTRPAYVPTPPSRARSASRASTSSTRSRRTRSTRRSHPRRTKSRRHSAS